ncbi:MAG: energy transducer TonB [Magnetovibrio sp.]|nr:energy transducer TonB [Magnetovibrio sp.]
MSYSLQHHSFQTLSRSALAFSVAASVHIAIVAGLVAMERMNIDPPQIMGGFEVVDLSAFGVAAQPEPEPVEEKPVEEAKVDPIPEPEPEPEPLPEPEVAEPEPDPLPQPVVQPKPKPKPEPKPKPVAKPKPKLEPKPKEVTKPKPKPKPVPQPQTASAGSQNAYVPPSSTAAYLRNPKPTYPALAQRRAMQGVVLLLVEVSINGKPSSVKVKKGSGFAILDKAALRAVRQWQFAPAKRGGKPIAASIEVPIRFILNDA